METATPINNQGGGFLKLISISCNLYFDGNHTENGANWGVGTAFTASKKARIKLGATSFL